MLTGGLGPRVPEILWAALHSYIVKKENILRMLAVKIAPVNWMNLVTACGRFINETFHIPFVCSI